MDTTTKSVALLNKDSGGGGGGNTNDGVSDPMKIDALRWRFETIFKVGFMILVSAILNATMIPPGPWSIYNGSTFKFTAPVDFIGDLLPCIHDLGFACKLYATISYACGEFAVISLRLNCNFYGDLTSSSGKKLFFRISGLISLILCISSLLLITGGDEGVRFGVFLLSFVSIVSVATFKLGLYSTYAAMWVLAQSVAVVLFLLLRGRFVESTIAFLPILPAIYALRIQVDNIYSHLVKAPSKDDDKYGSRAEDTSIEEAIFKVLMFFLALVISVALF